MIEHAALLKSAAGQIDELDREISNLNGGKKDIFAGIRETVAPELFTAWRLAIKLRQKRAVSPEARDALEEQDARVWEVLAMLEGADAPAAAQSPPAASAAPAIGIVAEVVPTRAHVQAHEDDHDLEIPAALNRRSQRAAA